MGKKSKEGLNTGNPCPFSITMTEIVQVLKGFEVKVPIFGPLRPVIQFILGPGHPTKENKLLGPDPTLKSKGIQFVVEAAQRHPLRWSEEEVPTERKKSTRSVRRGSLPRRRIRRDGFPSLSIFYPRGNEGIFPEWESPV